MAAKKKFDLYEANIQALIVSGILLIAGFLSVIAVYISRQ